MYWMQFYCKPLEIIVSRCGFPLQESMPVVLFSQTSNNTTELSMWNYWNTQPKQPNRSFTWSNKKSIRELHIYCIHNNFVECKYYSVAQCSSHVITFNFYVFFDDIVILSLEMDLRNKFILNVWIYQYNENISHKNVNKSKRVEVQKSSVFDVQESPRVKVGSRHHVAFTRMIAKNKCYF